MKTEFPIGSIIRNFGRVAKVVGYHDEAGSLIVRGCGLTDANTGRWIVDPGLCERLDACGTETIIYPEGALTGFRL